MCWGWHCGRGRRRGDEEGGAHALNCTDVMQCSVLGSDLMQRSWPLISRPKLLLSATSTSITGTSRLTPTDLSQDTSRSPSLTLSVPEGRGGGAGSAGQPYSTILQARTNAQFIARPLGQVFHDWRTDVARPQQQHPSARGGHGRHPHLPRDGGGNACSVHPREGHGAGGQRPFEHR